MTIHRLIYLAGQPGSGKSTLMARLTEGYDRIHVGPPEVPVAHDQLTREVPGGVDDGTIEIVGAELGEQRGAFGGTDLLPASIIDKAIPWIETAPYRLVLAEGQRLANKRFLLAAASTYQVTLALLDHADQDAWRRKLSRSRGRIQNEGWVKGRLTANRNLADQLDGKLDICVLRGHPDALFEPLKAVISGDG